MRAVRLVAPGRPLELHEVPVPAAGPRDVVVDVAAAGICRSDVHYRSGDPPAEPLPLTLGHEVAGVVSAIGAEVQAVALGDRVCLHYQVSCGDCRYCVSGSEQFCVAGAMLGKSRDGGYAEQIVIPARNVFPVPDGVSLEHAAVMMCSSATSLHALRKASLRPGETVAVFGVGGLGSSAVQIAVALGAGDVYAVDINPTKLELAAGFGAIPVDARTQDPVAAIRAAGGADVALELIGLPATLRQAVECLAVFGRAVAVGLNTGAVPVYPYAELIVREAVLMGAADHLAQELPLLLDLARRGALDLSLVVTERVPLEAGPVNAAMDRLEEYGDSVRTVIVP